MTLLTIAGDLATNVGMSVPTVVIGSTDRDAIEIAETTKEAADELARRVDWRAMRATSTLTGDGTNKVFSLPSGFLHVETGAAVAVGTVPLRVLSYAETVPITPIQGTPRFYCLQSAGVSVLPYLANASTATLSYYTKFWCSNGTDDWTSDSDTALISEDLILKGSIVRWRRRKGMDYADFEAEYEAALADKSKFDTGRAW